MDGRRINRRERKYNPLFILFLCLIAAVIVLLIVALAMGVKLGKANKSLKAAETQVNELQKTVAQLESDLETARGHVSSEAEPTAEPSTQPASETTPAQQTAQEQQQQQQTQQTQQQQTSGSSWLDLSGHNELKYKPANLLDGYQTYYTSEGVNLRSGPATSYGRITTVNRGTKVQVAAREGGWSFVKAEGKFGWINSDYLGQTVPAPVTSTSSEQTASQGTTQTTTRTEATSGSLKKS